MLQEHVKEIKKTLGPQVSERAREQDRGETDDLLFTLCAHLAFALFLTCVQAYAARKYDLAVQLYERLLLSDRLEDFLTLVAYPHITTIVNGGVKAKL